MCAFRVLNPHNTVCWHYICLNYLFETGSGNQIGGWSYIERNFLKLYSHQTADQPRPMPTNFYGLGGYDRVKKLPALSEERIYPRSTSAVSALYPWCTHAQTPLFPSYPHPSDWPIPALHDQPRPIPDTTTLTTLNIGPTPDLISTPGLQWIIQANVMA